MTRALAENVHLLTLQQWYAGAVLIRLEHFFQKDEDADLSKPVTVDLNVSLVTLRYVSNRVGLEPSYLKLADLTYYHCAITATQGIGPYGQLTYIY